MVRILKAMLVLSIGLHALFYVLQNIANFEAARSGVSYVLSMADHESYPDTLFFRVSNPALQLAAAITVFALEFAIGFFGIKGSWDLFRARGASAAEFAAAKRAGIIAAGLALFTWFGVFMTWGGAFFRCGRQKSAMARLPVPSDSLQFRPSLSSISAIPMIRQPCPAKHTWPQGLSGKY